MWPIRQSKYVQPATYSRRTTAYVDRDFQERITRYLIALSTVSSLLFMIPVAWIMNENYGYFMNWADSMNTRLSGYIFREQVSLNVLFVIAFSAQVIFWFFFTRSMTDKIAAPAKILRNHIRILSRGDFSVAPVRIREGDEFKELVNSYNYLFKLFQTQYLRELEDLNKLKSTATNPVAVKILDQLIEERALRLNRPQDLPYKVVSASHGEGPEKPPGSRHVS